MMRRLVRQRTSRGLPADAERDTVIVETRSRAKASLRERLKHGAIARAERDVAIAEEWFAVDEQAWTSGPAARRAR